MASSPPRSHLHPRSPEPAHDGGWINAVAIGDGGARVAGLVLGDQVGEISVGERGASSSSGNAPGFEVLGNSVDVNLEPCRQLLDGAALAIQVDELIDLGDCETTMPSNLLTRSDRTITTSGGNVCGMVRKVARLRPPHYRSHYLYCQGSRRAARARLFDLTASTSDGVRPPLGWFKSSFHAPRSVVENATVPTEVVACRPPENVVRSSSLRGCGARLDRTSVRHRWYNILRTQAVRPRAYDHRR